MTKKELRKHIIKIRYDIPKDSWENACDAILKKIIASDFYKNADTILMYASYNHEADTDNLFEYALKDKKEIYMPKVIDNKNGIMNFYRVYDRKELHESPMGIMEPDANEKRLFRLDNPIHEDLSRSQKSLLMIVPGVAFDKHNNRLGYGGGFYDRYIEKCRRIYKDQIKCVAIAFKQQIVDELMDLEITDQKMDLIITD